MTTNDYDPHGESDVNDQGVSTPVDWLELFAVLWSSRKLIAIVTGSAAVGAVIVSLLLPESFRSTATLLPETEKSKLAALGGLSDLAALAGVNVGGEGSLAKLYPTIIRSEAVLKHVIYAEYQTNKLKQSANLVTFWDITGETPAEQFESALKRLRDQLEISLDNKTGVVSVSIETEEPQLSADIVNRLLRELDDFIRTKRATSASEQRKWIEARVEEVKKDLERSENSLKEFREKNRRVGDSPQLLLQQERLIREMQINSALYTELKKQYEVVKIEEVKNIPIISVMDPGRAAVRKTSPRRGVIVLTTLLFAGIGVGIFVVISSLYSEKLRFIRQRLLFGHAKN